MSRNERLHRALEQGSAAIVARAYEALTRSRSPRYDRDGQGGATQKLQQLHAVVLAALKRRSVVPVIQHAESVARERFAAGFTLGELQGAFNALEASMWDYLLGQLPPAEFVDAIGLLSKLLGAGKDSLANAFLALSRGPRPRDTAALFRGTIGA